MSKNILLAGLLLFSVLGCVAYQEHPRKSVIIKKAPTEPEIDQVTSATKYNYEHKVLADAKKKNPSMSGRILKRRIAVARFGDLLVPAGSTFDEIATVGVSAQEKTSIEAQENKLVLEHSANADLGFETEPCPGFTGLLIDKLMQNDRFIVVERKEINKLLREQDFGRNGRVLPQTAAKLRRIRGVELMITGEVAQLKPAGNDDADHQSIVAFLRIYDVETGEIIASKGVKAGSVLEAVEQAAEQISEGIEDKAWSIKISEVRGGDVVILNAGRNDGVHKYDRFEIISLGGEIVDPDEGTLLDEEKTRQGVIEIFEVHPRYSKGQMLIRREGGRFKRGDLAHYITGPYGDDYTDYIERLDDPDFDYEQ